ncbi:MAG: 30S ribosomal protein S4 [Nanoarchaeota archaeon]
MGDPRKRRKNFARPSVLWNEAVLATDKEILREYKPKNKKEIWKMNSFLQNIKDQAKGITSRLGTARAEQAMHEKELLIAKVKRYGLIQKEDVGLSDLLNLTLRDVMDRRLQTVVFKKNLSKTVSQGRQFIVHGHVKVAGKKITSPSYLVSSEEENSVDFVAKSPMSSPSHPERGDVSPEVVVASAKATEEVAKTESEAESKSETTEEVSEAEEKAEEVSENTGEESAKEEKGEKEEESEQKSTKEAEVANESEDKSEETEKEASKDSEK